MTVAEYMTALPNVNSSACGYVLGLNVNGSDSPQEYLVFSAGAAEIKAEIISEIGRKKYVVGGGKCRRKFAVRKFTVLMDRVCGDPLQDFLLSSAVLFGREQQCVFDYVYFNAATRIGEKGQITVDVQIDSDGTADDVSVVSAELYGCGGIPESYIYSHT